MIQCVVGGDHRPEEQHLCRVGIEGIDLSRSSGQYLSVCAVIEEREPTMVTAIGDCDELIGALNTQRSPGLGRQHDPTLRIHGQFGMEGLVLHVSITPPGVLEEPPTPHY